MNYMNKKLIITVLLSFQMQIVFAQCISVELSVTRETGYDIFKKDSTTYLPKLHITYRNLSDSNYYFLKVSDSRNGLPMMPWGLMAHPSPIDEYLRWRNDYLGRAKSYQNYANQSFYVKIGGIMPIISQGWEVISDSLFLGKEQEYAIDVINDNLADIYEYIYRNNIFDYVEKKLYFSPSDLIPENIIGEFINQFVFLKPDETYIDTYNLIGFKLVEGCFTFSIHQSRFTNYVLVEPTWDKNLSCWREHRIRLPDKIGKYHLYSGAFFKNSITVDFSMSDRN